MIRVAEPKDIDPYLALAKDLYPHLDVYLAKPWVEWCLSRPDRLCLVGDRSFGIAEYSVLYGFVPRGQLAILGSQRGGWESFKIVKTMLEWAKSKGAVSFRLDANTGVDFSPFCRRLGGMEVTYPRYEIKLR